MPDLDQKVDEYFRIIQERILMPIGNTELSQSCTATLLLLFAAIDGLGGLLHSNPKAGNNERIRCFLDYMGEDYAANKEKLLKLRHSLVHSAINVESFLSKTEMTIGQHLKRIGTAGFIYVNTIMFYNDFVVAFAKFRDDVASDPALLAHISDRLEWKQDQTWDETDEPMPSPPAPVAFILYRT